MKAIFQSGDLDRLSSRSRSISIESTEGLVDSRMIQAITIKLEDARAVDLWWNPVTEQWSIGYTIDGKRVIIDLPETENV